MGFNWNIGEFVTKGKYISLLKLAVRQEKSYRNRNGTKFIEAGLVKSILHEGLLGHYDKHRWGAMDSGNILCEHVANYFSEAWKKMVKVGDR